jgi:glycosyltransferase involved in cell wall biosynthesis
MKILHIVDEPYDSGLVQYALKSAVGLMPRGVESRLWGLLGCYPVREAQRLGITALGYSHPWLNLGTLRRNLREFSPDAVVAHTGSAHTLAIAIAAWHGPHFPVIRVRGDARPLKPRPGRKILWNRTQGFIAANSAILDQHRRLYGTAPAGQVIYEGAADPGPRKSPLNAAPTFGVVARLDPVKGHQYFLEAAAQVLKELPDARFLLIGRQENVRSTDLLRQAEDLGIAGNIELTGHVPRVLDYIQRCDVGVVSSIGSEAVSRAAVEWLAAGRPLIATEVGCLPEYVDASIGATVPPRDSQSLAAAMLRLGNDSHLREKMGIAARQRYEDRFQLDTFLETTKSFYEQVLDSVPS